VGAGSTADGSSVAGQIDGPGAVRHVDVVADVRAAGDQDVRDGAVGSFTL
jgi:hypothetical protein